jgi:hypothetical protein
MLIKFSFILFFFFFLFLGCFFFFIKKYFYPSKISCTPKNITLNSTKNVLMRKRCLNQISSCGMHNSFGHSSASTSIDNKERGFCIHLFRFAKRALIFNNVFIIIISSLKHRNFGIGNRNNNDFFQRIFDLFCSFIYNIFHWKNFISSFTFI